MKKNKTLMIVLAFVLVMLLGIGLSYAYFSAIVRGTENASTISLEAGEMTINVDGGNVITATEFIPDSTTPFATKTITLTGKNTTSNLNMPYSLNLVVDENTFTAGSIKYSISGEKDENHPENGYLIPAKEMQTVDSTVTIGSGYFEPGNPITHTYTLELYFPDTNTDQSTNMNKTFKAHIEVVGVEAEEPAPSHWWKAETTTLLGLIRENSTLHTDETGMTVPGQAISNGDEQLRMTNDDYGVSFYFRGAVTNNYVLFANKCWRIVRIDGNGNIKLIFENNANNCSSQSNANDSTAFNSTAGVYDNNTGIGFMYGVGNSNNLYDPETGEHANLHDSTILAYLKTWYDYVDGNSVPTFTNAEKDMLADVIWCGDKTLSYSTSGTGLGSATPNTEYGTRKRLGDEYAPTLVCPTSVTKKGGLNVGTTYDIGSLSKYTAQKDTDADNTGGNGMLKTVDGNTTKYYKVGLLTADEVTFAGAYRWTNNKNYYLFNNTYWWTMSPYSFDVNNRLSGVWIVNLSGNLHSGSVTYSGGVRPAVSLKYDVSATYNTNDTTNKPGTASNPYVIS